jgi:hypothetical protein
MLRQPSHSRQRAPPLRAFATLCNIHFWRHCPVPKHPQSHQRFFAGLVPALGGGEVSSSNCTTTCSSPSKGSRSPEKDRGSCAAPAEYAQKFKQNENPPARPEPPPDSRVKCHRRISLPAAPEVRHFSPVVVAPQLPPKGALLPSEAPIFCRVVPSLSNDTIPLQRRFPST